VENEADEKVAGDASRYPVGPFSLIVPVTEA
jgi:hypothetical protein